MADRRKLLAQYSTSVHYLDKVYLLDLVTDGWELAVQRHRLFMAHHVEQASPFFDEDVLKMALAIHPDMRYIQGFKHKHLLKRLLWQKTNAAVVHLHKGPSTVNEDLTAWMKSGPLRPLVDDVQRPGFMNKADFEQLTRKSDYFLWPLLTYDIFKKSVLENNSLKDETWRP